LSKQSEWDIGCEIIFWDFQNIMFSEKYKVILVVKEYIQVFFFKYKMILVVKEYIEVSMSFSLIYLSKQNEWDIGCERI